MTEDEKKLEAARIISECKPSKLPYVLAILRQGGFDIGDEVVEQAKKNVRVRENWLASTRADSKSKSWAETEDPDVLLLRKAFFGGASLSKIANVAGVNVATVYKFMYAQKKHPTPLLRERIRFALKDVYGIEP